MSKPLALLEICYDGICEWVAIFDAERCKGINARRVIFTRRPTDQEFQIVKDGAKTPDGRVYHLDVVLPPV